MSRLFSIKELKTPLFGVVDASDASGALATMFSGAGTTRSVEIGPAAYDHIADELELDASGVTYDIARYLSGKYREKAKGPGGNRLGDFGEVLTFLDYKRRNRRLVRVVGYTPAPGQKRHGQRFPTPDFLAGSNSGVRAVEVKTTEALAYRHLVESEQHYCFLRPCRGVAACRAKALPQIGFKGNAVVSQKHKLRSKTKVVPFPVSQGTAIAVLVRDGRLEQLHGDSRFRTPKWCRGQSLDCWTCLSPDTPVIYVRMSNSPGVLGLLGSDENDDAWLRTYARWEQAIWAREAIAVEQTTAALSELTKAWAARLARRKARAQVRAFWSSYLETVPMQRGNLLEHSPADAESTTDEEDMRLSHEPWAERMEWRELVVRARTAQPDTSPARFVARLRDDSEATVSVDVLDDGWRIRMLSPWWWKGARVDKEAAQETARRLVATSTELFGVADPSPSVEAVPVCPVEASFDETRVLLGWRAQSLRESSGGWAVDGGLLPKWLSWLRFGDSRASLRIFLDGRATLHVREEDYWQLPR